MNTARALAACVLLLASGCAGLQSYGRSRAADLADCVPVSIAKGWGFSFSVKATPFFHVGLGTPVVSTRYGFEDRVFYGSWREYQTAFPFTPFARQLGTLPPRPYGANERRGFGDGIPLMYRWQVIRDAPSGEGRLQGNYEPRLRQWGRHPPVGREMGGAFVIPEYRRALVWRDLRDEQGDANPLAMVGSPTRATLWEATRNGEDLPQAWDLFEGDIFIGIVGVRVGLRPLEFIDLIAGLFTIDIMGDDIRSVSTATPQPLPEPLPPPEPPEPPEPPALHEPSQPAEPTEPTEPLEPDEEPTTDGDEPAEDGDVPDDR